MPVSKFNVLYSLPSHIVLQKDDSLKGKAKSLAENKDLLNYEFKRVEDHAKTVKKKTTVGSLDKNMVHNRYTDIGKRSATKKLLSSSL